MTETWGDWEWTSDSLVDSKRGPLIEMSTLGYESLIVDADAGHLIAAAPALYAALKRSTQLLATAVLYVPDKLAGPGARASLDQSRHALAKARGEATS